MMKFDGVYNGKLVRDWGDEEWSRFYHEVYAPNEFAAEGKNDERAKRLYLGPDLSDEEVIETLHYCGEDWSELIEGPVILYSERKGNSISALKKNDMTSDEYFENYPYTSVHQRFDKKYRVAYEAAKQAEISEPLDVEILEINETDAFKHLSIICKCLHEDYMSKIEMVTVEKEYKYLCEKYPSLKNKVFDRYILGVKLKAAQDRCN